MSRERHSEAYEDIQPAIFGKQKKQYTPPRIVTKKIAAKLFKDMHKAAQVENHLNALKQ
jgi:hypothetical protein